MPAHIPRGYGKYIHAVLAKSRVPMNLRSIVKQLSIEFGTRQNNIKDRVRIDLEGGVEHGYRYYLNEPFGDPPVSEVPQEKQKEKQEGEKKAPADDGLDNNQGPKEDVSGKKRQRSMICGCLAAKRYKIKRS